MIPRLLKNDAAVFDRLGGGPLSMAISCEVTENLGQAPELEMEILVDDPNLVNMSIGSIVAASPNKTDPVQGFVVEEMTKPIDGVVKIYAVHVAQHRGKLIPVSPFSAADLDGALAAMISNSVETNPFTLIRDPGKNNVTATMAPTVPHSFRELMGGVEGSILDTYRGEWKYNNFELTLYNRRGRDNGVRVMYGRNMSDFTLEESFSWNGSATGVVGYWADDEGTVVIGDPQYSALANLFPYKKTVVMDFSEKWENAPTKSDLETYAASWINGKGQSGVTVEVEFDHLDVDGGEDLGLGDTIRIYNGQYNFNAQSRIVGMKYDVLREEYLKVTIGDLKTTINEAISDAVGPTEMSFTPGAAVEPSTTTPAMDGVAAVGTEQKYARGDHVHPSDTSRFNKAGDDLTGNVRCISSAIDSTAAAPASVQTGPAFQWTDSNLTTLSTFRLRRLTSASNGAVVQSTIVNRNNIINQLDIGVDDNGARYINVTAPTQWRDALQCAPIASPAFTGNPTAPTQSAGNNSTRLATTAFVNGEVHGKRILGYQNVTLATTASTAADSTATTSGTLTAVSGATDYILFPRTCSYGIFTALSRSGTTINATLRNVSGAAHTMASSVGVIALG